MATKNFKPAVELVDPRHAYDRPPFNEQRQIDMPGEVREMNPPPKHGEETYVGSGKLSGLTAFITGADSGIGRAVANCFAREGAHVAIGYLSEDEDAQQTVALAQQSGVNAKAYRHDLSKEANCNEVAEKVLKDFGKVDILVNNAAHQEVRETLDEWSTDVFDRIFKTNVYATFWLSRAHLKHLPAGGSIINTVSIQGYDPSPQLLPYSATKSALLGMTKGLAKLAIEQGVRVNAVAPGPVWTPLIPATMTQEKIKNFGDNTLFNRPAQPIELAPLYVWLASPEASYVTGEVFGCTGGRTPV